MPANDLPPWLLWPGYQAAPAPYGTWNIAPAMGWSCPGCGHCYGPAVSQCMYCPARPAISTDTARPAAMHPCPSPLEGGMCGCEEAGDEP